MFRYYQLGLAYCFNKQFDESVKSYNDAIKVIEDRIGKFLGTLTDRPAFEEMTLMHDHFDIF